MQAAWAWAPPGPVRGGVHRELTWASWSAERLGRTMCVCAAESRKRPPCRHREEGVGRWGPPSPDDGKREGTGMEQGLGQKDWLGTPAAMTARVLNDAKRTFGEAADAPFLEACAREAVADLW